MIIHTKQLLKAVGAIVLLPAYLGLGFPALMSAKSNLAVGIAILSLVAVIVWVLIQLRNLLGLKPQGMPQRLKEGPIPLDELSTSSRTFISDGKDLRVGYRNNK